jgi:hypothetical protein
LDRQPIFQERRKNDERYEIQDWLGRIDECLRKMKQDLMDAVEEEKSRRGEKV